MTLHREHLAPAGGTTDAAPPLRVLMLTSAWPQPGQPQTTHFVKRQAEFLHAAGVNVDVYAFRGQRRLSNYVRAWRAARRRLDPATYDIVHAQFGQSGLLALPTRIPLVVTLRGSDILGIVGPGGRYLRKGLLLQAASRLVCRHADAVVIVSEHMRAFLPRGVLATVLPSGLDFELFAPVPRAEARARLGLHPTRRYVLFAGNPAQPRKRHALAVEAMRLLPPALDAELLVAWGVPHRDMPVYMSAADAMIFTSMQEGSPNVVKEALACNLPVASVDIGDVTERLAGIAGCEVAADDRPASIAAAVARVLTHGSPVAARPTVLHLDERACTQRLIGIYHTLARRATRPRAAAAPGIPPTLRVLDA